MRPTFTPASQFGHSSDKIDLCLGSEEQSDFESLLGAANAAVDQVDGSELAYNDLMSKLIKLDSFLRHHFPDAPRMGAKRNDFEDAVAGLANLDPPNGRTISALLDSAQTKVFQALGEYAESVDEIVSNLESMNVLVVEHGQVFIPTDGLPPQIGSGAGFGEIKTQPRLQMLISELASFGIFKEDLIVRRGKISSDMMRKHPYFIVEIPRLGKEVAVCNEVGEATFVSQLIRGARFYAESSKQELEETDGVARVVFLDAAEWICEIGRLLVKDQTKAPPKVDVNDLEALRASIASNMTESDWAKLNQKQRKTLKVPGAGKSVYVLGNVFGTGENDGQSFEAFLRLGERIYGFGGECSRKLRIHRAGPGELAAIIKNEMELSEEEWIRLFSDKNVKWKILDSLLGFESLGARFGIEGNPACQVTAFYKLGEMIYGIGGECSRRICFELANQEELAAMIRSDSDMSEKEWVEISAEPKRKLYKVPGSNIGEQALASRFNVSAKRDRSRLKFLKIGEKTFGVGGACTSKISVLLEDKEYITSCVLDERGMSETKWADFLPADRNHYQIPRIGFGLPFLARIFGLTDNPGKLEVHLKVGEFIFGIGGVCTARLSVMKASPDELIAIIKGDSKMTEKKWVALNPTERLRYKVPGSKNMGLGAIATRLGFDGDPYHSRALMFKLGVKIFGAGGVCSEKLGELE